MKINEKKILPLFGWDHTEQVSAHSDLTVRWQRNAESRRNNGMSKKSSLWRLRAAFILTLPWPSLVRGEELLLQYLLLEIGSFPSLFWFSLAFGLYMEEVKCSYPELQLRAKQGQERSLAVYKTCSTLLQKLVSIHKLKRGKCLWAEQHNQA